MVLCLSLAVLTGPVLTLADTSGLKGEVDNLNAQVRDGQDRINELNSAIRKYQERIRQNETTAASLQNEIALLENRVQEKQLAVERAKQQIDVTNLQIQSTDHQIDNQTVTIARREDSLAELIRQLEQSDSVSLLDVFLARPSLSSFFSRLEDLKKVEHELADATQEVKDSKAQLEQRKRDLENRRKELQDQKRDLQKEQDSLEQDRAAKASLISVTQSREEEFQRIIYELRQQQQQEASNIEDIQDALKDKLDSVDEALARGDILLNWPMTVSRGISAHFHDPSYPFRKFFEHPGVDIPTPVGTPVHAAAGGYVAWNKTGKQYGNYTMIVHPGGIATVYAHLSRFAVKPDTYVERGEIIGYSGGQPGDEGAGLSTGAHVHFEVRQNGIPVNPENFLPSLD